MDAESTLETLQGELERLFDLDGMMQLSLGLLGFEPEKVGGTGSKGAFARALIGFCSREQALPALVDAMLMSNDRADQKLRDVLRVQPNGELKPGTMIGGMRVVKKLGEGGLSIVYLAEARGQEGKRAAVKVIRPQYAYDRAAVHRFTTLSRSLASMKVPGLASILEVGQLDDARPWVAAEYVSGQTLADRIKRTGCLHINEARPVFLGVLKGLGALHARGLIHGDVKVENVFVVRTDDGNEPSGLLVDAGADRLLTRTNSGAAVTGMLPMLGTAKAIAPEQARGTEGDARSDIYQMGTLMYETLAGRPPFEGDTAIDVVAAHLSYVADPPSEYARKGWVSERLDEVVLKCLAKDPGERYATAAELIGALENLGRSSAVRKPFDAAAYDRACQALLKDPASQDAADALEQIGRDTDAWDRVATGFGNAANVADGEARLGLLFRMARILESDVKNPLRAEAAYQQILEIDDQNQVALNGVEAAKRAANDHDGLLGILLDKLERQGSAEARTEILHEVAELYEQKLGDDDNATVAWTQALINDPNDERAQDEVERLAGGVPTRWNDALTALNEAAQQAHARVFTDQEAQRQQALAQLQHHEAQLAALHAHVDQQLQYQRETARQARANAGQYAEAASRGLEAAQQELEALAAQIDALRLEAESRTEAAEQAQAAAAEAHAGAEGTVQQYETLEREYGEAPDEAQQEELATVAAKAEELVDAADKAEAAAGEAAQAAEAIVVQLQALEPQLEVARDAERQARGAAQQASAGAQDVDGDFDVMPSPEQQNELRGAERAVEQARAILASFEGRDADSAAAERAQSRDDLVRMYAIMGNWYATKLLRPDFALPCYSQALTLDPANDGAFDGVIELYRASQSWGELAGMLLQRADRTTNPVKGRDYRAEAAQIIALRLNDSAQARRHFEQVLRDDPAHPVAQDALAEILIDAGEVDALVQLLEKRLEGLSDKDRVGTLLQLAELYEDQLSDLDRAQARFEAVVAIEPRELNALKGLERIYARGENYEGLRDNLRAQVDLAPTPKQRIALFERIGLLQEEEFVDHAGAARSFEDIVAIDPGHDAANTALARLYRHLRRFEDVVDTLDRHAAAASDDGRKIDLLMHAVRVLTVDVGSPERAIEMCERVLAIDDQHAEALSELARLRSTTGDTRAALDAVERLAERETDALKRCDLWIRAAKLLEDAGDRDNAISRYKKALDANPQAREAAEALKAIYTHRGDAHGAIEMLLREIEISDGALKKAELYAELGGLRLERLDDEAQATEAFEKALELDATATAALIGLGRIAFRNGDHAVAAERLQAAIGRLDELPKDRAAEICIEAGESFKALGQMDKALEAFQRARDTMPEDLSVNERHAAMVLLSGDAKGAERAYERIFKRFESQLDGSEKVRLLLARGEAELAANHAKQAVATFKEILDMRPDDGAALDGLTRAYEGARDWNEVINTLQLRSRRTTKDDEVFDLMVKTGDVFLEKIRDRDAAAQTYVMALDVKPDSRNLLTKLMSVYSDAQDWPRLIEIILRIAEMVQDKTQLAKYYNTAATIAHHELGRFDEAANYYEEALANLPGDQGDAQLQGLVDCLTQNQDWDRLERAYERAYERRRDTGATEKQLAAMLDARANVVQHRLNRLADAIRLYEEAQQLDQDNRERRKMLTQIYTKEPKRFFQRAVSAHRYFMEQDPYHIESLQALRKIYTSGKKPDESWCLCQALRCLKMADVDEEKFFKKYRLTRLARAKHPMTEEMWRGLMIHPAQDPILTAIFTALTPAVVATQAQSLQAFSVDPSHITDPANDSTAMGRMLAHVSEATGVRLPPTYHAPRDAGGLSFLFTTPPSIGIGQGAKAGGPQQALAFVAGRHLSYFHPGHFLRQQVPTGTGLRAWLLSAIRLVQPKFPIPSNMEPQVKESLGAIKQHLSGPQRDALRSLAQKLLDAAPELDMKGWMAGVDLTADRVGFVMSNDLKIANAVIEASPEESSSVNRKDRLRELLSYSTSERYFELRKQIGIALGG